MNIEETLKGIQKKIGKESSSKIADDIATIITYDSERTKELKGKDDEIKSLKSDKEMLITANGNLLKQVSQEREEEIKPKKEEPKEYKAFDFREALDERGYFKK